MKFSCNKQTVVRRAGHSSVSRAFTLVEVAIALAVIGFALVAIIGILPAGLNVQKENREETVINQDASIWINAVRSGAEGIDYLVDYVDGIEITTTTCDIDGIPDFDTTTTVDYSPNASPTYRLETGRQIIGLMSTPKYEPVSGGGFLSNNVVAYVRAISGAATDLLPQNSTTVKESAFAYRLTTEILPYFANEPQMTNYAAFRYLTGVNGPSDPGLFHSRSVGHNLHELRLRFEWPLRPPLDSNFDPSVATNTGPGRLTFRAMMSGKLEEESGRVYRYYYMKPGRFERPQNPL